MNQRLYEGRFLASVTGAVVRQDELKLRYSRMDWERLYRLADSHRVAPILYLGILGIWEPIPAQWKQALFERYIESLRQAEAFPEAVTEICTALDMNEISCVILTRGRISALCPLPEIGGSDPLRLLVEQPDYVRVKGYLVDLGYEMKGSLWGFGERMSRPGGISLELYWDFPFRPAWFRKVSGEICEEEQDLEGFLFVRELTGTGEFLFRTAAAAFHYVTDELTIREMLDLYYAHKICRQEINGEYADRVLSHLHIDLLAEKILDIAYLWFGGEQDRDFIPKMDQEEIWEPMENKILARGMYYRFQGHTQAEGLAEAILKETEQEERKEIQRLKQEARRKKWMDWKRKAAWIFPGTEYMKTIYPILERLPFLLPFFWFVRWGRMIRSGREKQ